ncbi:MAG TPA: hypothetical protein VMW91_05910 [Desulfosporosinus sp.]|nr:hypothetical protein [Desulfosporosinus sp.]
MGWPRKVGFPLLRKNVVDAFVIRMAIEAMVKFAVVLGAKRPDIAIRIIADIFRQRDSKKTTAAELWERQNPTAIVAAHPEVSPAEAIARFFCSDKDMAILLGDAPSQNFVPEDFVTSETISFYSTLPFAKALVWGIEHPQEALTAFEDERRKYSEKLPDMISSGLKLDPPYTCPTSDDVCKSMQELISSYQNEVRSLSNVPQDLLDLPSVAQRITDRGL